MAIWWDLVVSDTSGLIGLGIRNLIFRFMWMITNCYLLHWIIFILNLPVLSTFMLRQWCEILHTRCWQILFYYGMLFLNSVNWNNLSCTDIFSHVIAHPTPPSFKKKKFYLVKLIKSLQYLCDPYIVSLKKNPTNIQFCGLFESTFRSCWVVFFLSTPLWSDLICKCKAIMTIIFTVALLLYL